MNYTVPYILSGKNGNNIFSYEERQRLLGRDPTISIPALRVGNLADATFGNTVVFEEIEDNKLLSCFGLKEFIRLKGFDIPITIFDNHNHALYFWLEGIHTGYLQEGFELIHIDEHSDLWGNENILDREKALSNLSYVWEFTNFSCNVGNYIEPAKNSGFIEKMIRIENDFQVEEYIDYIPSTNSILNLDLDFFAPEMDFIDEGKKITLIRHLLPRVRCVTIATSPFFIDQKRALEALLKIFLP